MESLTKLVDALRVFQWNCSCSFRGNKDSTGEIKQKRRRRRRVRFKKKKILSAGTGTPAVSVLSNPAIGLPSNFLLQPQFQHQLIQQLEQNNINPGHVPRIGTWFQNPPV